MKTYQKIIAGGVVISSLLAAYGCKNAHATNMPLPASTSIESTFKKYFKADTSLLVKLPRFNNDDGIAMAVGDMDRDEDLDIIVAKANSSSPGIRFIENLGKGKYEDRGLIADIPRHNNNDGIAVSLADMDGDGDLDILVAKANSSSSGIRYIENNIPQKNK